MKHVRVRAFQTYFLSERDPCHMNPCLNNGVCESVGLSHICRCQPGYHGANCRSESSDLYRIFYTRGLIVMTTRVVYNQVLFFISFRKGLFASTSIFSLSR